MKKLIIPTLLGLLLAIGTFAQSGTTGPLTWTLSGGTLTISGNGAMPDYVYPLNPPWGGNMSEVIIKDGVTSIGAKAFKEDNLTSIIIGNSVKSIGWQAFYGCKKLSSITIPNSITLIDLEAFRYCSALTSVTIIDNGAIIIGTQAFQGCGKLASVNFGNGVKSIEDYAFNECSSLTSVTIPNSVTKIGSSAFAYCNGLTSVSIGNGVTSIGFYAFNQCLNLASVSIGGDVKTIADKAFGSCPLVKLTVNTVTPPDFIWDPFLGIDYRTCILEVPAGSKATYQTNKNWRSFLSIYETGSVVVSGGATGNLTWAFANGKLTISGNGEMPNYSSTPVPWDLYRTSIKAVDILQGVTSIGSYAFYRCDSLTTISIGNSVTRIGYAFFRCSRLSSVNIPNSAIYIDDRAFQYCSSLTSVIIGNGLTNIGEQAFWGCNALAKLRVKSVIPPTVRSSYVFVDVNKQTCILEVPAGSKAKYQAAQYWKDFQNINEISVVTGITGTLSWSLADGKLTISGSGAMPGYSSPDYAPWYSYRSTITAVEIPEGVTSIGSYAFYDCSSLTSVTIPNSLKSAREQEIKNSLTSVIIPASVTSIGEQAFSGCSSLGAIYANSKVPIDLSSSSDVFKNVNKATCKLFVAIGSKSAYQTANQWKDFIAIEEKDISTGVEDPDLLAETLIYTSGQTVYVKFTKSPINAKISVFDITGRLVALKIADDLSTEVPINKRGIYLVRVEENRECTVKKVLINE